MTSGHVSGGNPAQQVFGPQAGVYAQSPVHMDDPSLDAMRDMAAEGRTSSYGWALDLGTGAGFTAFAMAQFSRQVVAMDPTPGMLAQTRRIARERDVANVAATRNVAESLPVASGSVELVTSRMAAHHFPGFESMLEEVSRVLRPGGVFLMADSIAPADDSVAAWMNDIELRRDFSHIEDRQEREIERLVEDRGMAVTHKEHTRIGLRFNDWAARTATSPGETEALRRDFLDAPDAVRNSFQIVPEEGDIAFSWPCLILRAVKG